MGNEVVQRSHVLQLGCEPAGEHGPHGACLCMHICHAWCLQHVTVNACKAWPTQCVPLRTYIG